ncbi:hypothetical protein D3C73_1314060 [compost metagenome]
MRAIAISWLAWSAGPFTTVSFRPSPDAAPDPALAVAWLPLSEWTGVTFAPEGWHAVSPATSAEAAISFMIVLWLLVFITGPS